jgi:hypothetical protein
MERTNGKKRVVIFELWMIFWMVVVDGRYCWAAICPQDGSRAFVLSSYLGLISERSTKKYGFDAEI